MKGTIVFMIIAGKAKDVFEQIATLVKDQGDKTLREVLMTRDEIIAWGSSTDRRRRIIKVISEREI